MNKLFHRITELPIIRYFFMAILIVGLEVFVYYLLNSFLGVNYLLAVPLSMTLSIVLNWYISKKLVFKQSKYKNSTEIMLVLISSIIGIAIQISITFIAVEILNLLPIIGKVAGISTTFFWNFYVRKLFIFRM